MNLYDPVLLDSSYNAESFRKKITIQEKLKTEILCSIIFFPKMVPFTRMWKNMVEPDFAQIAVYCRPRKDGIPHAGYLRQECKSTLTVLILAVFITD